jgi:hypothetical protein
MTICKVFLTKNWTRSKFLTVCVCVSVCILWEWHIHIDLEGCRPHTANCSHTTPHKHTHTHTLHHCASLPKEFSHMFLSTDTFSHLTYSESHMLLWNITHLCISRQPSSSLCLGLHLFISLILKVRMWFLWKLKHEDVYMCYVFVLQRRQTQNQGEHNVSHDMRSQTLQGI